MNRHYSINSFLWRHIKPYTWYYVAMLSAPIIGGFYPFAYNYAIKMFLDAMAAGNTLTYSSLLSPIMLFLGAEIGLTLVWRLSAIAEWKAEPYVRRSILLDSYNYVQHHSYTFFQNNFTGAVSSKIKGLLTGYDKFWAEMHHGLLARLIKITINICALLIINYYLGLFVILWGGVVYGTLMYMLSKKLNRLAFDDSESVHRLIGQVADKLMNITTLFSHASRKREVANLYKQATEEFIPKQVRLYKYDFLIQVISSVLYFILFAFLLFYMIHLRFSNVISIGDFAFVFGIALVVAEDLWHATESLQEFTRAMGDLKSALSVLNTPQESLDKPEAGTLVITSPSITFHDVHFTHQEGTEVFRGLSLSIKAGEKVGLVGRSGAGKSTLINLLLRYFEPERGTVAVDSHDIQTITQDSLRSNIAMIPQDTMLFHRSLLDNIRYGNPNASDDEVMEASKKAHVHDFIMTLPDGYETFVGERGIKLSGGQRQRVSIARAILKDAPILILDEATSSLDSHTEQLIQESLRLFIEDAKKTVIAVAHRLSTLKHMDRIIVLDQGSITEEGTHKQLIKDKESLYRKLWKRQEI